MLNPALELTKKGICFNHNHSLIHLINAATVWMEINNPVVYTQLYAQQT